MAVPASSATEEATQRPMPTVLHRENSTTVPDERVTDQETRAISEHLASQSHIGDRATDVTLISQRSRLHRLLFLLGLKHGTESAANLELERFEESIDLLLKVLYRLVLVRMSLIRT